MKIQTRLSLAFAALLAILAAVAALSFWQLQVLKEGSQQIADFHTQRNTLALRWGSGIHLNWLRAQAYLKASDPAYQAALQQDMDATVARVNDIQKALEALMVAPDDQALVTQVGQARQRYVNLRNVLLKRKAAGESIQMEMDRDLAPQVRDYLAQVERLQTHVQDRLHQSQEAAEATAHTSQMLLLVAVLAALALGAGVAVRVTQAIVRPLGGEPAEAARVARAVAEGDLSLPIVLRPGDSTSLMAQLRDMQVSLAHLVGQVRDNAQQVALASAEIATGNGDLSARTESQASALEQTAASMEELGSAVRHNADHAGQASRLAHQASDIASRGGQVVGDVVHTMKGIQVASRQISDIIGVIDGIAFQTNILALNAAVEAARAGEQGRGFAVVAGEVRALARRSADAAHQIKDLITDSVARVEQGTGLVDQAGVTMGELVTAIHRVTALMADISAASAEQDLNVHQVGEAVGQMDLGTQQNAALVEEMAAAAASLQTQSQALVRAVAVFKLTPADVPAEMSAPPARGTPRPPRLLRPLVPLAQAA